MLDLNLEEVEVYYISDNLDFYRFTPPSKLTSIEDIDAIYITII